MIKPGICRITLEHIISLGDMEPLAIGNLGETVGFVEQRRFVDDLEKVDEGMESIAFGTRGIPSAWNGCPGNPNRRRITQQWHVMTNGNFGTDTDAKNLLGEADAVQVDVVCISKPVARQTCRTC